VVEAQMMAIVRHSRWMGVTPETLHVAGGAAVNREILQVLADMSGAVVVPLESTNAASLGAAVRAWHAGEAAAGHGLDWDHVVSPFLRPAASGPIQPRRELRSVYDDLMRRHEAFETASLSALRA
jgi:xylulokinase